MGFASCALKTKFNEMEWNGMEWNSLTKYLSWLAVVTLQTTGCLHLFNTRYQDGLNSEASPVILCLQMVSFIFLIYQMITQ